MAHFPTPKNSPNTPQKATPEKNKPKKNTPKITTQQLYLTYSYDCLAMLTSLIAVSFVMYSIYVAKVLNSHTNQSTLVTLIVMNFACIVASFLFKHKLQQGK